MFLLNAAYSADAKAMLRRKRIGTRKRAQIREEISTFGEGKCSTQRT